MVARQTSNLKVSGSNPEVDSFLFRPCWGGTHSPGSLYHWLVLYPSLIKWLALTIVLVLLHSWEAPSTPCMQAIITTSVAPMGRVLNINLQIHSIDLSVFLFWDLMTITKLAMEPQDVRPFDLKLHHQYAPGSVWALGAWLLLLGLEGTVQHSWIGRG